jgi:prophage tail gpP-like protein
MKSGDLTTLSVAEDPIIVGYSRLTIDTNGVLFVEGRDRTGDLVDCTPAGPTTFLNRSVLAIIQGLASPFGITAAGDSGPTVAQFAVASDERVSDAILRLVSNYGIIVTSDAGGNLVVTEGGNFVNPGIAIRNGQNIDEAVGIFNDGARYSAVTSKGQNYLNASLAAEAVGTSQRVRPLGYLLNGEVNQSDCQLSADRLRDFTEGSACKVVAKLTTLDYYPAGTLITVDLPQFGIDGDMLIETTILSFETGIANATASVTFELVSPQKYGGQPLACAFLK